MITRKRTSPYGIAMYATVLPIIICLIMAFTPNQFLNINQAKTAFVKEPISLGLPIDKKYNFLLESGFGERLHPVLNEIRLHTGIDLITEEGVPVVSAEEGVVIKSQLSGAWGNLIVVQHDDTYSTSYSHLKSMNVKEGDQIKRGQMIGQVGNTGLSTKFHLHFELRKNGVAIDPINYLPQLK